MKCEHYENRYCNLFNIICQYRRTLTLECPIVKKDAEIERLKGNMSDDCPSFNVCGHVALLKETIERSKSANMSNIKYINLITNRFADSNIKKDMEIVKLTSIIEGLMDGSYIAVNKATKYLERLK